MSDDSKQRTQPEKGEPIEIPIPKRSTWDKLISKVAKPKPANGEAPPR